MKFLPIMLVVSALVPTGAMADQVGLVFGGDAYAAGQNQRSISPSRRMPSWPGMM